MYASYAKQHFSDDELTELLIKARKNNSNLGITGMLIYRDGNFIQVLEGEEEAVKSLYILIKADKRHDGVIIMSEGEISERQFAKWAMDFRNYSKNDLFTTAEMANDKYGILTVLTDFVKTMH
jgi:hypothetical protein